MERLYRLLVIKAPARFHKTQSFTLTGLGGNAVALPADFRQLREGGITKDPNVPSSRRTLRRFNFGERDAQGVLPAWGGGRELAYDIQGTNIFVEPASLCAGNYALYYLFKPIPFVTSGDLLNDLLDPYVDYIAHWAAIKGLMKEESLDTAETMRAQLSVIADEIQAEFNEGSDPATIIDVEQVGGPPWP
jgi:hypothetical protein